MWWIIGVLVVYILLLEYRLFKMKKSIDIYREMFSDVWREFYKEKRKR